MKLIRLFTPLVLLGLTLSSCYHKPENTAISGIINSYAAVLEINPCEGVVVDRVQGFVPDQLVLIVQMKGARVDQRNHEDYGSIRDLAGAGLAEYARISHIEGRRLFFDKRFVHDYDTDGAVQIVSVPEYDEVIVESPLYASRWDGKRGGIVALHVRGKLVLKADIDVSAAGFRGGQVVEQTALVPRYADDYVGMDRDALSSQGEGVVAGETRFGRGASANAGGGGGNHNAGGGGGSNAGEGGSGGYAYAHYRYSGDRKSAQGLGGYEIQTRSRLIAGGGGGAGHSNNRTGSNGAAGGGIVVIKAGSVVSEGGAIRARGGDSETSPYDGAGGAGAGGTIYLQVAGFHGRDLHLDASGGTGGNTANGVERAHVGAGGGGGGGVIYVTRPEFGKDVRMASVRTSVSGGQGGVTVLGTNDGTGAGADGRVLGTFDILIGRDRCDQILTGSDNVEQSERIQ